MIKMVISLTLVKTVTSKSNENWYYVGNDGKILTGYHTIDGVDVYFDNNGVQAKGTFDSNDRFHDKDTGGLIYNQFITVKDKTYYIDDKGNSR